MLLSKKNFTYSKKNFTMKLRRQLNFLKGGFIWGLSQKVKSIIVY